MRGSMKVLLAAGALAAAVGACGRAEHPTAADGRRAPAADLAPLPGTGGPAPQDTPPPQPDTTGRWGGGLGSGT